MENNTFGYMLLAIIYGTIIFLTFAMIAVIGFGYGVDKYYNLKKKYKRKHLKFIKGNKRDLF